MMLPTIHLNGTSRESLERAYRAAHAAADALLDALAATAPNGRDYYVQGPEALPQAVAEHRARMDAVRAVLADMEALLLHVMEAE